MEEKEKEKEKEVKKRHYYLSTATEVAARQRYARRGVSATKEDVHSAIRHADRGLYPGAFCKIIPDILGGNPEYCNVMHADGAGTKSSLAYVYWKETDDISIWKGIAQDAIIMNIDDLLCVGAIDNIILSNTIGRNKRLIPGEVIETLITGVEETVTRLRELGIGVHATGGETADVGDLVRTLIMDSTVACRMRRSDVIDNSRIEVGDVIVGLASDGTATYDRTYNSGIGSNGLTSARHDMFAKYLSTEFPESYDGGMSPELVYTGEFGITEAMVVTAPEGFETNYRGVLSAGQLVLSPTRTYAPIIKKVFETIPRNRIHGMIHCTGGGQTKILHFIADNQRVIKDNLFEVPHLFDLIKTQSGASWTEMYQVFNMGHRMELCVPASEADAIIEISKSFEVDARVIGRIESSPRKCLILSTPDGPVTY